MRSIVFIGLFLVIFGGHTPLSAQKWSAKDKKEFSEGCASTMIRELDFSKKLATGICDCLTDRLEQKYPKMDDLNAFIEKDTEGFSEMMKEEGRECGKQLGKENPEAFSKEVAKNEKVASQLEYDQNMEDNFIQECQSAAKNQKDLESINVNQYCSCMWDKIKEKYPQVSDFLKIIGEGQHKLMANLKNEVVVCVQTSVKQEAQIAYTPELKKGFMDGCVKEFKGNKEINGKKYCSCFLEKLQVKYPNFADYLKMVEEGGENALTDAMKPQILECLGESKK